MERFKRIERRTIVLVIVAVLFCAVVLRDFNITLGVTVGGVIELINFHALRRFVEEILRGTRPDKQVLLAIALALKFVALAACFYGAIHMLNVNVIALIAGVSLVVVSIIIEGFYPERRRR